MKSFDTFESIYIHPNFVDFRKGIFSLSMLIQSEFGHNPFDESLYLFTNKKRNSIKAIYWDKTGFAMWQKLLEKEKFPWPRNKEHNVYNITIEQLNFLLSGIDFLKLKKHEYLHYSKLI